MEKCIFAFSLAIWLGHRPSTAEEAGKLNLCSSAALHG